MALSENYMSFLSDNPGIGVIILGAFICIIAIGFSPFGMSMFQIGDFSVEGGPEGIISGPLFALGVIMMAIGAYIQIKR